MNLVRETFTIKLSLGFISDLLYGIIEFLKRINMSGINRDLIGQLKIVSSEVLFNKVTERWRFSRYLVISCQNFTPRVPNSKLVLKTPTFFNGYIGRKILRKKKTNLYRNNYGSTSLKKVICVRLISSFVTNLEGCSTFFDDCFGANYIKMFQT
ncbi:hypothetical protein BpHYR1_036561 [Brachionus plicatilis]|uniref:Uncharacterized protein n=1 Tax=Brachionus plicatilis TaxID=10195 RepID=A0A3M7PYK3_BRAPC|nr:hypothetical protein BpHYR1_036561 [Brachionus plicatilis]